MKTVYVRATRNLDMMNEGVVAKVDRDEQVDRMINAGYLEEVDAPEEEQTDFPGLANTQDAEPKPQKATTRTR